MTDCTGSIDILVNDESLKKLFKIKKTDAVTCIQDISGLIRRFVPDEINKSNDLIDIMTAFATLNGIETSTIIGIKVERRKSIIEYAKSCFGGEVNTYIEHPVDREQARVKLYGDGDTLGILTYWVARKLNWMYAESNCHDRSFFIDIKPDFDFLCGLSTYIDACNHAFYNEGDRLKYSYIVAVLCEKYVPSYNMMTLEEIADYLEKNDKEVYKFTRGDYSSELLDCLSVYLYLLNVINTAIF